MKRFFKILSIARQRKYLRRTHAVSPSGETSKCAYVDLKEKRVSALTVYFFVHVKTLHLRFDALSVCSRSELRLEAKSA